MGILNTVLLIVIIGFNNNPEKELKVNRYINDYKELAVIEMYRSGIPASITLAQALHESQYGSSELAVNANNHFGIKCKSYWEGSRYHHKDDDYDKNGILLKSCFRAYNNVFDSYIDHSNFLMHTKHYQGLFKLDRSDYESWAKGLQMSGYATDPNYAKKLISYIEKYNLDKFDRAENPFIRLKSLD